MTRERVLVVEHDLAVRLVYREVLQGLGQAYTVDAVGSTEDAWDLLRDADFGLVLIDTSARFNWYCAFTLAVRRLDGCVALLWVVEQEIPHLEALAERLGVYASLQKPVEVKRLRAAARDALAACCRWSTHLPAKSAPET